MHQPTNSTLSLSPQSQAYTKL